MNLNCWESSGYNRTSVILTLLPPAEFSVSRDFFSIESNSDLLLPESALLTLASEHVLSKEWDTPEEDEAWENL